MLNCLTRERRYDLFRLHTLFSSCRRGNLQARRLILRGAMEETLTAPFSLRRRGGDKRGLAGDVSIHL